MGRILLDLAVVSKKSNCSNIMYYRSPEKGTHSDAEVRGGVFGYDAENYSRRPCTAGQKVLMP